MPRNKTSLLLNPFFLFNLFLLIANDHWWKHTYSNSLTGKISDFAGLVVMAVFLIACCRLKKIYAILFTALFFTWWKSPLSEPFIAAFNLARVIDYSDLIALIILPAVFYLKPYYFGKLYIKYTMPLVAFISWTAIVATTLPYRAIGYEYPPGRTVIDKAWKTKLTIDEFFYKLDSLHIPWKKDSLVYLPVYGNRLMLVVKTEKDSVYQMTPMDNLKDTLVYYEKNTGSHFVIPYFVVETDTITNIRFRMYDAGRKRVIELMEMIIPPGMRIDYYTDRKLRKKIPGVDKVVYA